MNQEQITAIILAGGKSSRMGFDKGLAEINSVKMIERVLSVAKNITDNIIIISNTSSYNFLGLPVYEDLIKECGPIGGIYTGLNYSNTNCNFIVACDMPYVDDVIVKKLIREFNGYDVVVPVIENNLEPLCACYSKRIAPFLKKQIDDKEYSVYKAINHLNYKAASIGTEEKSFININTQSDLNKYNR